MKRVNSDSPGRQFTVHAYAARRGGLSTARGKALAAINRTVVLRNEGNASGLATLSAHSLEHLTAFAAVGTAGLTGIAASLAASGLVLEALLSVESLLTSGEHELVATILTNQRLVFVHWNFPLIDCNRLPRSADLVFDPTLAGWSVRS